MNKAIFLLFLCACGCSCELLPRNFGDIKRHYSSRIKISSHDYFIIEDVATDDYLLIVQMLKCHGFNEWIHLASSEGFVLDVNGHALFRGSKNVEIEYSICDEVTSPYKTVILYVKNEKFVIIARASALGG